MAGKIRVMHRAKIMVLFVWMIMLAYDGIAQGRQRLSMDYNWKFSQTDTAGADKPGFDDRNWRTVDLPHDWSIEHDFIEDAPTTGRGGYLPTGTGWYRKHFVLPASATTKHVWVEFDGVYQNSDVWINGHHLGHYPNGYMSFYYDLSDYVKAGENLLIVRVDNSKQPNTRWYSGSGIYRHVWLTITNPVHVAQWGTYITTPTVDSTSAVVNVATEIENSSTTSRNLTLRLLVLDAGGNEVTRKESSFAVNASTRIEVNHQLLVSSPSLWSVEAPYMYSLKTQLVDKKKVIDETVTPFGIRAIQYDTDKGFFLNGKHVKMNGVCLHHDAGSVGAAVPEKMWVRRLEILKAMGCNAIRTSHNPMAPEFMDLCDRMGFLVQDEVFDEWTAGKVQYGYSNYFEQWSQHDLKNFIRRDRNHPSVVMWSAGNEIGEQKMENGHGILKPLIDTFHRLDPTRPVTTGNDNIAADNGSARLPFLEMLDIVGYNYVDRWHERRELYYSIDRHDHPHWKMTGTESVSIPGVRGNYFGGSLYNPDSSVIRPAYMPGVIRAEQLWKFVSTHDYVIGDYMWTGIDYLGEARWPNKNASSGVIDLCGFPKDGYYFYQSQWTNEPMVHVFPHWNWKGHEGKVIPVMMYTNCDTVELFVNGKSFGMKSLEFPRQGTSGGWNRYERPVVNITTGDLHLIWDVPYEPGTLRAVGRKNGKILVDKIIYTTGTPAGVQLSVDHRALNADDRDVAHVTIAIVDSDGRMVPNANNTIEVSVTGSGKLIGLDNGNPVDHTSMKSNSRKVFNGLALAVIQVNGQAGKIHVKVSSPGLKDSMVEILAEHLGTGVKRIETLKK